MENKYRYLPQVNIENEKCCSEKTVGKYPCPCCGYLTLPVPKEEVIAYICPVCYWENDVFCFSDDEASDENHGIDLITARENYKRIGACRESMLSYVRNPLTEEMPD